MIKKAALLARDNSIKFFFLGFILLFTLLFFSTLSLLLIHKLMPAVFDSKFEYILVLVVYLPVMPVFFLISILFLEKYLNFFKVGFFFGLQNSPFLRIFLRWADVEQGAKAPWHSQARPLK